MFRVKPLFVSALLCVACLIPVEAKSTPIDVAQKRIERYLRTMSSLPKDLVVAPATGTMPWPESSVESNVLGEVWTVHARDGASRVPLLYFVIHPETGEVFALFASSLQKNPVYTNPVHRMR